MEKEPFIKMVMSIEEILKINYLMEDFDIKDQMGRHMKGNGDRGKSMGMEIIIGQMEVHIKVNILVT